MRSLRSLLFAPAVRPDRFERACASEADAVCIDLEDATPPAEKDAARDAVSAFLSGDRRSGCVGVRINAVGGEWWEADLEATGRTADFIMLPKASSPAELDLVSERLAADCPLWPLVETAEGLMRSWAIAAAERVGGVLFGAFDYAADVGCAMEWEPLLFARSQVAAACARSRVELLDAPAADIRDRAGLVESSRRAKALGFTGRACIHPDQVGPVNEVFTPSPSEVDAARRVLQAFEAAGGGAVQLDGKLLDLPVALAARRVLARAGG